MFRLVEKVRKQFIERRTKICYVKEGEGGREEEGEEKGRDIRIVRGALEGQGRN